MREVPPPPPSAFHWVGGAGWVVLGVAGWVVLVVLGGWCWVGCVGCVGWVVLGGLCWVVLGGWCWVVQWSADGKGPSSSPISWFWVAGDDGWERPLRPAHQSFPLVGCSGVQLTV